MIRSGVPLIGLLPLLWAPAVQTSAPIAIKTGQVVAAAILLARTTGRFAQHAR